MTDVDFVLLVPRNREGPSWNLDAHHRRSDGIDSESREVAKVVDFTTGADGV